MNGREALAFVERHGIVLMAARGPVPSLAEAIAGEALRGSWWGHPRARHMFRVFSDVCDSEDVLVCRLVDGKVTFVHRRLWPALVRLAARLPKYGIGAIREEHTPSGKHRTVLTPFPRWVPAAVRAEARRLTPAEAQAALGIDLRASATGKRVRRSRGPRAVAKKAVGRKRARRA
jgi:hypothetical protein